MKKYLYLILFFLVCVPAIAGTINSYTLKSPPDDADTIVIYDSDDGSTKKTTVGDISSGGVAASGWTDGGANVYLTDSTDSVGMGTHTPSSKLQVVGSVTATTYIGDGSALTGISSGGWSDNGTNVVLATSTDNVGIGSTSPISALDTGTGVITSPSIANDKVYNVKKYGAKGDGIALYDGAILTGTDDFTSATAVFTSSDVGKVITISNAAGTNLDLTTTISAYVDSHSITLSANASATVSGSMAVYGTDDTQAIRNAVDAIYDGGSGPHQGTVFFPIGIYIVNGAFDQTNNSQIDLPTVALDAKPVSITFLGSGKPMLNSRHMIGSTIFGTRYGTDGTYSIISGKNTGQSGDLTWVRVHFQDIAIKTVQDPTHTALNLLDVDMASGDNVLITANVAPGGTVALPTHNDSYGLIMPGTLNGNVSAKWTSSKVIRFYNGIQFGEHSQADDIMVVYAVNALLFKDCRYPARVGYVSVEISVNSVVMLGAVTNYFVIDILDIEHSSGTFANVYDLSDSTNLGQGSINYTTFDNGGGNTFVPNGGKNVSLTNIETGAFEIKTSTQEQRIINSAADSTTSGGSLMLMQNDLTALGAGQRIGLLGFAGSYNTSGIDYVYGAAIQGLTAEAFTASAAGTHLQFRTTPTSSTTLTERMRITSQGNVGIGTLNPTSLFQVGAANSTALRFDGTNLGIGTTAPGATLDIGTGNLRVGIGTTTAGTLVCVKSISGGTSILGYCTGSLTNSICGTCN